MIIIYFILYIAVANFKVHLVGNYEPMPASCSSFETILEMVLVEWVLILVVNKNDAKMSSSQVAFCPGKRITVLERSSSTFEMNLSLLRLCHLIKYNTMYFRIIFLRVLGTSISIVYCDIDKIRRHLMDGIS